MNSKIKNIFIYGSAVLITVLLFVFLNEKYPLQFAISDDMQMRDITSGGYSGTTDGHTVFIKYVLGYIISCLYKGFPQFNWYGIIMLGIFAFCLVLFLIRAIQFSKARFWIGILTAVSLFILYELDNIVLVQFTMTANILGITSIFWLATLCLDEKPIYRYLELGILILLAVLCYAVREKVFYMTLPFMAVVGIYYWSAQKQKINLYKKEFIGAVFLTGLILASVWGVEKFAYASPEWNEHQEFNKARGQIVDYGGYPDYDTAKELYDNLGITEESYRLLTESGSMILDHENINTEAFQEIAHEKNQESNKEKLSLSHIRQSVLELYRICMSGEYTLYTIFIAALYGCLILLTFVIRDKKTIWSMILIAGLSKGMCFYLIWEGRYPSRVIIPIFLLEIISLLAVISLQRIKVKEILSSFGNYGRCLKIAGVLTVGFLLYGRMIHFESYALSIKDDYALRNASVSYCNSHKENFYLIDMNSISIFLGSNGLWSEQELGNTISLGGWHVFSPLYYEKLKNYNIKNLEQDFISRDNVYLIIRDTVAEETLDNYLDYYAGKGIYVIPELVDSFSTTQGRVCEVYSFSKNVME